MTRVRGLAASVAAVLLLGCAASPPGDDAPEPDLAPPAVEEEGEDEAEDAAAPRSGRAAAEASEPEAAAPLEPPADEDAAGRNRTTAPTPPPPPPPSRPDLQAAAEALLADLLDQRQGEQVAVYVVDEHGRELVAHDADVPVLPASTMKTITTAGTLITFGSDHRFTTRVEATAPVEADGVLRGDLVLIGTGDPVLATPEYERWIYPVRPRTPLESLADQLVAGGLTRLEGDVVGVAEGFVGPERAAGWPETYFWSFDARWADGLAVDAGLHTIVIEPEVEDSDEDSDADDDTEVADDAEPAPSPGPPEIRIDHTPEPALHATREFLRLLVERDVEVVGEGRIDPPPAATVGRLASVQSPTLEEILRFSVQRSDNQISDALFRTVGQARTGTGSFAAGEQAHLRLLEQLGLDTTGLAFADGSGLSRDDRLTARLLVDLDRTMRTTRHAASWHAAMASMGETGTLRSRLVGTAAVGRFAGKTGSLNDVQSLSGTVVGPTGRSYHLAVIANADGQARWLSRVFVDELILLLVRDLDRDLAA